MCPQMSWQRSQSQPMGGQALGVWLVHVLQPSQDAVLLHIVAETCIVHGYLIQVVYKWELH